MSLFNQNFFSITYDFAIDNNLNEFNRNSLQFKAGNQFINFTNTYYEIRNHIGNTKFNETTTSILLSNNYYVSSTYRKNLDTNQSESASFSLNYENDCIRYSLSTDKSFYLDKDIKPDRKITFNIIIKPYEMNFTRSFEIYRLMKTKVILLLLLFYFINNTAYSKKIEIIAKVNNDIITNIDLYKDIGYTIYI